MPDPKNPTRQSDSTQYPRTAVLGVGAIGGLLASEWAACGLAPTLLLQDEAKRHRYRSAGGLRIEGAGTAQLWPLPAAVATDPGDCWDLLLVCTKAWAAAPAVASVAARISHATTVVLICNGLGVEEEVRETLNGVGNILLGSTTQGAYRISEFSVCHAGIGQTTLGGRAPCPEWFTNAQTQGLSWHWEAAISNVLWRKLLINCAINPLAALYRCRNGELTERPDYRMALDALIEELSAAARLQPNDPGRSLAKDIYTVIQNTAQNRCSMLQDLDAGRPTEKDFILGYLLRQARASSLALPLCTELFTRLEAAENPRESGR